MKLLWNQLLPAEHQQFVASYKIDPWVDPFCPFSVFSLIISTSSCCQSAFVFPIIICISFIFGFLPAFTTNNNIISSISAGDWDETRAWVTASQQQLLCNPIIIMAIYERLFTKTTVCGGEKGKDDVVVIVTLISSKRASRRKKHEIRDTSNNNGHSNIKRALRKCLG